MLKICCKFLKNVKKWFFAIYFWRFFEKIYFFRISACGHVNFFLENEKNLKNTKIFVKFMKSKNARITLPILKFYFIKKSQQIFCEKTENARIA